MSVLIALAVISVPVGLGMISTSTITDVMVSNIHVYAALLGLLQ